MRRFLPLLPLLLLVGCGQPKTKAPLTQGLPTSTNVWAQLSLTSESKQANKAALCFRLSDRQGFVSSRARAAPFF